MRTLHADLITAQKADTRTPYIELIFKKGGTTVNYTTRLERIFHPEKPYNSYAEIVLDNSDLAVVDITGYWIDIGYGYNTTSGNRTSAAPRLWVVQQSRESEEGRVESVLYLEGIWRILREIQNTGGLGGSTPYLDVQYDGSTSTVYDILEAILETVCNVDLDALGGVDDSIIDTLKPVFSINAGSALFEDCASMIYRLLNMTKTFLRPSGDYAGSKMTGFEVVHPQAGDSVDYEYYSDQSHYFYQCFFKDNVVNPNHIIVIANQDADGGWTSAITGEYDASGSVGFYDEDGNLLDLPEYHLAAELTSQGDADLRAEAIYLKLWHELEWGVVVVPHNCGQELFDKVKVYDSRGA